MLVMSLGPLQMFRFITNIFGILNLSYHGLLWRLRCHWDMNLAKKNIEVFDYVGNW